MDRHAAPDSECRIGNGEFDRLRLRTRRRRWGRLRPLRALPISPGAPSAAPVLAEEAILELIQATVLLLNLIKGSFVEILAATRTDLLRQFLDPLCNEEVNSLNKRTVLGAPPAV